LYYSLGKADEAKKYIDIAEQKYHSESVVELRRLIEQLAIDKEKIEQKAEPSPTVQPTSTP
jgi:hypothetical protein